jgi:hypothetical protein
LSHGATIIISIIFRLAVLSSAGLGRHFAEISPCFYSESPRSNVTLIALGPLLNVRLVTIKAEMKVCKLNAWRPLLESGRDPFLVKAT